MTQRETAPAQSSAALRCGCGNTEFEFSNELHDDSLLRCLACERVYRFGELRDRIALETFDPAAALEADDVAAELKRRDITITGVRVRNARHWAFPGAPK